MTLSLPFDQQGYFRPYNPSPSLYAAILFLREHDHLVYRVSDDQHRITMPASSKVQLLRTHELKAYAKKLGWVP